MIGSKKELTYQWETKLGISKRPGENWLNQVQGCGGQKVSITASGHNLWFQSQATAAMGLEMEGMGNELVTYKSWLL